MKKIFFYSTIILVFLVACDSSEKNEVKNEASNNESITNVPTDTTKKVSISIGSNGIDINDKSAQIKVDKNGVKIGAKKINIDIKK